MQGEKKVSIIMPARNAARHIEAVIRRIPEDFWPHIKNLWIINDGSTDGTGERIVSLMDRYPAVQGVYLRNNKGYGAAVQIGLRQCLEDRCDYAVCLHADGQYPPELMPRFLETMQEKRWDILQGSRLSSGSALSGGMPLYKFIAGKVMTFFENLTFNLRMSDYHSGYLFYSGQTLRRIPFYKFSKSFDFDLECIASARANNLAIGELPIPTRYADEISYLNPLLYGFRVLWILAKYRLGFYRRAT